MKGDERLKTTLGPAVDAALAAWTPTGVPLPRSVDRRGLASSPWKTRFR